MGTCLLEKYILHLEAYPRADMLTLTLQKVLCIKRFMECLADVGPYRNTCMLHERFARYKDYVTDTRFEVILHVEIHHRVRVCW